MTDATMRHRRHYTLQQAMAARDWVAQRVGWVREAHASLEVMGASGLESIESLDLTTGGAYPGREVAHSLVQLSRAAGELDAMDIVVRDVARGLIDFPAVRDGEEVYLCWLLDDEESIAFWHEPDAGFAGRRPL
jgi:hypothetical protein